MLSTSGFLGVVFQKLPALQVSLRIPLFSTALCMYELHTLHFTFFWK